MLKMMRRMVLVDMGPVIDQLGAELIETPEKYKRIPNIGTIISIGPKCRTMKREDLGEECLIPNVKYSEYKFNPNSSANLGLKKHWHFMLLEDDIQLVIHK